MFLSDKDMACEFAGMLVMHMGKPAWPGLDCPQTRRRIIDLAREFGCDRRLIKAARPDEPILAPVRYHDLKSRTFDCFKQQAGRLGAASLALWMDCPGVNVELVEDLMWSLCETSTIIDEKSWMVCGNDGRGVPGVQLFSSAMALRFAECIYLLRDRLDAEVVRRMRREVVERTLLAGTDWRNFNWWLWGRNNQNLVNASNLIAAGLYIIEDVYQLASFLHRLVESLSYGLEGFTDDGGCTEGIDYWDYGFSHFVMAAIMLHHRTGGMLDIMRADPKIERICRYPLAVYLEGDKRACWADSWYGYISSRTALMIQEFFDIPELFACCRPNVKDWASTGYQDLYFLSIYRDQQPRTMEFTDAWLPELGIAKVHVGKGRRRAGLAVQGGHNGVHHNHNDIGSYLFVKDGVAALTEAGIADYSAFPGNFGKERYDNLMNNSFGHPVPIINGHGQPVGSEARGQIKSVKTLPDQGKRIVLDLTRAYHNIEGLESVVRTFELSPERELLITDDFTFAIAPSELIEQFITYEDAEPLPEGVHITGGGKNFLLSACEAAGEFTVERLEQESKLNRGQGIIRRIRFKPAALAPKMTLHFRLV